MDPSSWYLTLPTGRKGDPHTVQPPKLGGYSSTWFRLDSACQGLVFTPNACGVTTSGSSYPSGGYVQSNTSKGDKAGAVVI